MAGDAPSVPTEQAARERLRRLSGGGLLEAIRRAVRTRAPAGEIEDVVNQTFVRLLVVPVIPEVPAELEAYAVTVAIHAAADAQRARARRARRTDGEADVDAAIDPRTEGDPAPELGAELEHVLAWLDGEIARGALPEYVTACARGLAEGRTYAEMGEALGRSPGALRVAMHAVRKHVRAHYKGYAAIGVVLALVFAWRRRGPSPIAPDATVARPVPSESARPAASVAPPSLTTAEAWRDAARGACRDYDWDECASDLDEAKKLDPLNEALEDVRFMREAIRWKGHVPERPRGPDKPTAPR